jgi:DNA repair exonuclease SbcCD nuclease subunit
MRFIHSADWQMGMAAVHAGDGATAVRQARLDAARAVIHLAQTESVDFILLAGDTFESNAISRALVRELAAILSAAPCPVFVLPGNHDPLIPGSVWEDEAWARASNVHVLRQPAPVTLPGGVLYPCPIFTKTSHQDPTAWIPNEPSEGIRIGIAHGTVGDLQVEDGFPIPFDAPSRTGLDYLALGHWHGTLAYCEGRMAYSGTHETASFREKNSGNVLLVDIANPGAPPVLQTIHTGLLEWRQIEQKITQPGQLTEVSRDIKTGASRKRLIDVRLSGQLFEGEASELERIRQAFTYYLSGRLADSALRPAPTDDDWIRLLPAGVAQHAAAKLRELAARPGEDGAIATQALRELYALHSEVKA